MRRVPIAAVALTAIVMAGGATPAAEWTHETWDRDANAEIDRAEFGAGLAEARVYEQMDANADGVLDSTEFYGGVFDIWDDDDDLGVSEDEFGSRSEAWLAEAEEHSDFNAWDANADGVIGEDEFRESAGGSGLYETWGGDDGIAEQELGAGLYDAADADNDDVIRSDEHDWNHWF